ncbi:hypothetical protein BC332_10459 [Capsicum chinense]|nr:hypothetical protein BC332_10459 [Capsicum chinense]
MMIFEEMKFCGDLDFFPSPLKKVEMEVIAPQNQIELDSVVDDNYSDEEIDVDEPNFDILCYVLICRNKDCMWVLRASSMNESKIDAYMRSGC